jgi:hypothetical protein
MKERERERERELRVSFECGIGKSVCKQMTGSCEIKPQTITTLKQEGNGRGGKCQAKWCLIDKCYG